MAQPYTLPVKDPTSAQAAGSAITYARRYSLCSVIGICPEDDDGAAASSKSVGKKVVNGPGSDNETLWRRKFDSAVTVDEMKDIYQQFKHSAVQEPEKTKTLTEWSKTIKGLLEKK